VPRGTGEHSWTHQTKLPADKPGGHNQRNLKITFINGPGTKKARWFSPNGLSNQSTRVINII